MIELTNVSVFIIGLLPKGWIVKTAMIMLCFSFPLSLTSQITLKANLLNIVQRL